MPNCVTRAQNNNYSYTEIKEKSALNLKDISTYMNFIDVLMQDSNGKIISGRLPNYVMWRIITIEYMIRHECKIHTNAWTLYLKDGFMDVDRTISSIIYPNYILSKDMLCDIKFEINLALFLSNLEHCEHGCRLLIWQIAMRRHRNHATLEDFNPSFLKNDNILSYSKFYDMTSQKISIGFATHFVDYIIQKYGLYARIAFYPKLWSKGKKAYIEVTGKPKALHKFYISVQKIFPCIPDIDPHTIQQLIAENEILNGFGVFKQISCEHYFGELKFTLRILSPYSWSGQMIAHIDGTRITGENKYMMPINTLNPNNTPIYLPLIASENDLIIDRINDLSLIIKSSLWNDVFLDSWPKALRADNQIGFGGSIVNRYVTSKLTDLLNLPEPITKCVMEYTDTSFSRPILDAYNQWDDMGCMHCDALIDVIHYNTPCCNILLCIECTIGILKIRGHSICEMNLKNFICVRCAYARYKRFNYKYPTHRRYNHEYYKLRTMRSLN